MLILPLSPSAAFPGFCAAGSSRVAVPPNTEIEALELVPIVD
jgi:hypothetical protein